MLYEGRNFRVPDRTACLTTARKDKTKASPGEIYAVLRRIAAENGRDYAWHYALAALFLVIVAGTTAFTAWIMRDVVDEIFYRQRADLIVLICLSIVAAFVLRGVATYGQAVVLAKVGNNLVARYQRRIFDHLMTLGMDFFSTTRSAQLAAQINQPRHVLALLQAGADPNARNAQGQTFQRYLWMTKEQLLNEQTRKGRKAVVKFLQRNGIPVQPAEGAQ